MGTERKVRYRLYVDESGDHAYKLLGRPDHRYLALLGVWFRQSDDYVGFADALEGFKRRVFGPHPDHPVILHRSDIINRKGPFGILTDPARRDTFDQGLLEVVAYASFKVICVVIDKKKHLSAYESPFHPYHYCLAALLDRYSGYLNFKNALGDVMAESRGREEDRQLEDAYHRVYESGTLMFPREHHQRALSSRHIKIKRKEANIPGLQLADILAHPVKQSMLMERAAMVGSQSPFGARLLQTVARKLTRNVRTGKVWSYGKVML